MLNKLLEATREYNLWDWTMLKLALVSAGILLGLYLYPILSCYKTAIWIIFIICYLGIAYRTLSLAKKQ